MTTIDCKETLRCRIFRKDDYAMVEGKTRIGRVYKLEGESQWHWVLQTDPAETPKEGVAGTPAEAMEDFKRCYAQARGFDVPAPDIKAQIADELYTVLERLGTDSDVLAIIGSWRDTLSDAEVLQLLRDYNAGRPMLPQ